MDQLLAWIDWYAPLVYLGLFAYCALKSGALPLFAGVAASFGALNPLIAISVSFLGGYLGDEARFFVARRYGLAWLSRKERTRQWLEKSRALMERHGKAYMFIYRYPKGMRTIGALPVGLTDISWQNFTLLNFASAALWAILMVGAGLLFGDVIVASVEQGWGVFSIALLVLVLLAGWVAWRRLSRYGLPEQQGQT